jgi:membrane-associated protease RseP (regulator of RpoE activity)
VGYLLLVLLHELGHAAVVRYHGHEVESLDVHGLGGLCRWSGLATPIERATIAWGGVWAQMVIFAGAHVALAALGDPTSAFVAQLAHAATSVNLWLMAINLIPLPPLDGAEAWSLFRLLWVRQRAKKMRPSSITRLIAVPREVRIHEARREELALKRFEVDDDGDDGDGQSLSPEAEELLERVRAIAAREGELAKSARIDRKD